MDARAAPGAQAGAAPKGHDGEPPNSETGRPLPSTYLPPFSSATDDAASSARHDQQQNHPDERRDGMSLPRPPPAPTPQPSTSSLEMSSVPASGLASKKLARKRSAQDLYLSSRSGHHRHPSPQRRPQSSWGRMPGTAEGLDRDHLASLPALPALPSPSVSSSRPLRSYRSWAGPQLRYAAQHNLSSSSSSFWLSSSSRSSSSSYRLYSNPLPHAPTIGLDQPIEVDEAFLGKPSGTADVGRTIEVDERYVPGNAIEVDQGCEVGNAIKIDEAYLGGSGPAASGSIEVDEAYDDDDATATTTAAVAAVSGPSENLFSGDRKPLGIARRIHRQSSGLLKHSRSSTRPLNPRVEGMITNETQCNVRSAPLLCSKTTTTTTTTTTTPAAASPIPPAIEPFIEPDPSFSMPSPDPDLPLEVDSTMPDADNDPDLSAVKLATDQLNLLRYSRARIGARKRYLPETGVALMYRRSEDAGLMCKEVVWNPLRMRRRNELGKSRKRGSSRRSVVSSTASWCGESDACSSALHSPELRPADEEEIPASMSTLLTPSLADEVVRRQRG
ncbi:hypothetical protein VTJ83DRAFT_7273 [Remersonia thermophila]|uniref:Uncharacterized protein n=1 Tax=Remersonia thermophila TaxID=72144 RepID=A0ABR4D365_9PEZI